MKRRTAPFLSATATLAAGLAIAAQSEILAKLKTNETEANERIFGALTGGFFSPVGDPGVFKAAAPEARVAMVKAVMALARAYTTTADFTTRYRETRESEKPKTPEPQPSGGQLMAQQKQGLEEAIANATKMAKDFPAMKKELDATVVDLKKQLAEIGKDPTLNAQMEEGQKMQAAADAEAHKEAMARWEKAYPADPRRLIASRLREFLELSGSVDFAAQTEINLNDHKRHFVNEAYEEKDNRWKALYRAGKPAVDAARLAAQEWLKALGV